MCARTAERTRLEDDVRGASYSRSSCSSAGSARRALSIARCHLSSENPAALVHGMEEPIERCHRVAGQFYGSHLVAGSFGMPVGRAAVVCDPFGNTLVLVDLSKGTYTNSLASLANGVMRPDGGV